MLRVLPSRRLALATSICLALGATASAQTVSPTSVFSNGGPGCSGSPELYDVSVTLPPFSTSNRIDVFLLFDDTGSFADEVPRVVNVFTRVVALLQNQVPSADIAYGVGRLEDYGGPGSTFSSEFLNGRPFILNQAILSRSSPTFVADLQAALSNTAPGFGGDLPETSAGEALYQVATGAGFDANGNGSRLDSGPAGALSTQIAPGTSGDVPPFSSYVGSGSGSLGGVGWRANSQRIVILATEICSVAAFDAGTTIPNEIVGTGSTEPVTAFQCPSGLFGSDRFGFVSDSLDVAGNTVTDAVAPLGSATIPATVAALNAAGIRVMGLAPNGAPTTNPGPSANASVMLSALARLTSAVDANGEALVFDTSGGELQIAQSIVNGVLQLATTELDLTLVPDGLPAGLTASFSPNVIPDVGPGETATFTLTLTPDATYDGGQFDLRFRDVLSGSNIAAIPFNLICGSNCTVLDFETEDDFVTPLVNGEAIASFLNFERILRIDGVSDAQWSPAAFDTSPTGPNANSSDPDLLVGTGNALVLQENGASSTFGIYSDPDDDAEGGVMLFSFFRPSTLCSIDLIDIDPGDGGDVRIILSDLMGRVRVYTVPAGFTEDIALTSGTGVRTLDLTSLDPQPGFVATATAGEQPGFNPSRVVRMRIIMGGSGAIDNVAFILNTALTRKGGPDSPDLKFRGRVPGERKRRR